jgi:hypothetical protein
MAAEFKVDKSYKSSKLLTTRQRLAVSWNQILFIHETPQYEKELLDSAFRRITKNTRLKGGEKSVEI